MKKVRILALAVVAALLLIFPALVMGQPAARPPDETHGDGRRGKGPRRYQGHRNDRRRVRRGYGDDHGRYRLPE